MREGGRMKNEKIEQKLVEVLKELGELKARVQRLETWVEAIGERLEDVSNDTYDLKRKTNTYDPAKERRRYSEDYDE